ncbi:sigma-70 family RNA polymerase sigma factor [Staphylococcus edaphicus]|uniref:DNA-binding protein n=1 Tax=Staphylococcus edaphicus TaxID=1955013 RepID=A0A2C6WP59_9STAP|nr:sigma-70 family RNA polymerase sigma factor [Staphylococcus edaphicus]PHK50860.1 DNA-binding protein [Staphylococcus edaphicus]UQW82551.1 sigma-70 family RNA polymerase sigma factor [Staphylococcus edaphicus]
MHFEQQFQNSKYILYFLLKKYRIKYNNDEYMQLLTIKLWEISKTYNAQKSPSFHTYLYTRLNFYLIDLFRKQNKICEVPLTCSIDAKLQTLPSTLDTEIIYRQFQDKLTSREKQWLQLKLEGYKQKEIAHHLACSVSTVKNYQQRVQAKYLIHYKH